MKCCGRQYFCQNRIRTLFSLLCQCFFSQDPLLLVMVENYWCILWKKYKYTNVISLTKWVFCLYCKFNYREPSVNWPIWGRVGWKNRQIRCLARKAGRAMAQAVTRWPLTAEAQVHAPWDLWWTKWHWGMFFSEFFSFPCQYHSTVALHYHISSTGPLEIAVQSHSLTPLTWTWWQKHTVIYMLK
jgi:hypothetical protein